MFLNLMLSKMLSKLAFNAIRNEGVVNLLTSKLRSSPICAK